MLILLAGCLFVVPLVAALFWTPQDRRDADVQASLRLLAAAFGMAVVFLGFQEAVSYGHPLSAWAWEPVAHQRRTMFLLAAFTIAATAWFSRSLKLIDKKEPGISVLRVLAVGVGFWHFLLALLVVTSRIGYPFELEWMEASSLDAVRWQQSGHPLYMPATKDFCAAIYGPFFYRLQALVPIAKQGSMFLNIRWVSFSLSLGLLVTLYRLAIHWSRGWRPAGLIALGLFSAGFQVAGTWWDMPRVDVLCMLAAALGFFWCTAGRERRSRLIAAGIAFGLSCYAKQPGIIFGFAAAFWLYWVGAPRRQIVTLIAAMGLTLAAVWGGEMIFTRGDVARYCFALVSTTFINLNSFIERFIGQGMARTQSLWVIVLLAAVSLRLKFRKSATPDQEGLSAAWILLGVSLFFSAAMTIKSGWLHANIPMMAALAVILPVIMAARELSQNAAIKAAAYCAILLFGVSNVYNPYLSIPTVHDLLAGERLVAYVRSKPGPVLVFGHPTYAALAGKPSHIHYMSFQDWMRSGGPVPADLMRAVSNKQYGLIALDGDYELRIANRFGLELGDLIRSTYHPDPEAPVWVANELIPVVGGKKRPSIFLVPNA